MSAEYRIDLSNGIIFSKGEGVLTTQEIRTHNKRLREDPDFDPNYNQLIEIRVTQFAIPEEDVKKIAAQEDIFSGQSKRAFVAETDYAFGMCRMLQIYSDSSGAHSEVFRDMDEARRWLGLD
ncbi:hypothetical protein [Sneathiella sp.]|jgi:hypothetical protein|uniref:hypothetical protein n=1 Tax=Sneathiella sp. TaxID=1964365 RepID=UPI0039E5DFBA